MDKGESIKRSQWSISGWVSIWKDIQQIWSTQGYCNRPGNVVQFKTSPIINEEESGKAQKIYPIPSPRQWEGGSYK